MNKVEEEVTQQLQSINISFKKTFTTCMAYTFLKGPYT